jgi:hypothetical protein
MLGKLLVSSFIISLFSIAAAQEVDAQVGIINNKKYVCLEPLFAKDLLQIRINFPKLEEKIKDLEALIIILDEQVKQYDQLQVTLTKKAEILQQQTILLNKKLESANSWWRNPYLWGTAGLFLGVGASFFGIYLSTR